MPTNIINSLSGSDLHVVELTDPNILKFYASSIADQINKFRMSYSPQKKAIDLTDWIADIIIETSAQGASLLEVHIIDPAWTLFMRDKDGVSFIDVDAEGFLWPPIEVKFPADKSDSTWRLAQCRPSTSLTEANVILVFEDKIVAELREHSGPEKSHPNETRAEFIQRLVQQANKHPAYPGEVDIRFVHLLPKETFTTADLSLSQRTPTSAKHGRDPNKKPGHSHPKVSPVQAAVGGVEISIAQGLQAFANEVPQFGDFFVTPPVLTSPFAPIATVPNPFK